MITEQVQKQSQRVAHPFVSVRPPTGVILPKGDVILAGASVIQIALPVADWLVLNDLAEVAAEMVIVRRIEAGLADAEQQVKAAQN